MTCSQGNKFLAQSIESRRDLVSLVADWSENYNLVPWFYNLFVTISQKNSTVDHTQYYLLARSIPVRCPWMIVLSIKCEK